MSEDSESERLVAGGTLEGIVETGGSQGAAAASPAMTPRPPVYRERNGRIGPPASPPRPPSRHSMTGAKCGAMTRSGTPCQHPAGQRTDHLGFGRCSLHGGKSPSGITSAKRAMAASAVVTYGLPVKTDPHTALLHEVYRTAGHVAWIGARIQEADPNALVWGALERKYTEVEGAAPADPGKPVGRVVEVKEGPSIQIWLELYQRERKHLVDVCRTAIQCGIAERQVRIAEEQGAIIARIMQGVLVRLGIDPSSIEARAAMREQLALAAGGTVVDAEVVG